MLNIYYKTTNSLLNWEFSLEPRSGYELILEESHKKATDYIDELKKFLDRTFDLPQDWAVKEYKEFILNDFKRKVFLASRR